MYLCTHHGRKVHSNSAQKVKAGDPDRRFAVLYAIQRGAKRFNEIWFDGEVRDMIHSRVILSRGEGLGWMLISAFGATLAPRSRPESTPSVVGRSWDTPESVLPS